MKKNHRNSAYRKDGVVTVLRFTGTTAHAVMALNEEDEGSAFILLCYRQALSSQHYAREKSGL